MTRAQELLADGALTSFALNGRFLALAEELAKPAGLTAAWWQVLGAVLPGPQSVSQIARDMGMSRQGVQRVADLLVEREMATYADNPAHRRAKLLQLTEAGHAAMRRINPQHRRAADALVRELGEQRLAEIVAGIRDLTAALDGLAT